jgi:hypothetical protein
VIRQIVLIIDQFHCWLHFQRCLKK